MTAGIFAAALAAMLVAGLVLEAPPSPWAARRRRREAADLEAWAALRAAFYAASVPQPPPRPARAGRPRGTAPRRHGPRMWAIVDPVD